MTCNPSNALAAAGTASPPTEAVLSTAHRWAAGGARLCLMTLSGIDGTSPRPLGAQMVVDAEGRHSGQLSSGCVEASLVELARQRLNGQRRDNRLRIGAGGDFIDLRLPCGSTVDIHLESAPEPAALARAAELIAERVPMRWLSGLGAGRPDTAFAATEAVASLVLPPARIYLSGNSVVSDHLATHLRWAGCELQLIEQPAQLGFDPFSAVVTLWHDHDRELPVLQRALESDYFYIGCLGSRRSHRERLQRLSERGLEAGALARITAPAGSALMSREPPHVALAIAVEVIARYEQLAQRWAPAAAALTGS